MRLELRSEMVDFGRFCQAFINQEMYACGSGSTKFGSQCTQNGSELKTREPFFSLSPTWGKVGQFFSYGAVPKGPVSTRFHASGDQPRDFCTQVRSEFTGYQKFLYSGKIGVRRDFRDFCTHRIGVEPLFEVISVPILYAPGSEFHQDSPPS